MQESIAPRVIEWGLVVGAHALKGFDGEIRGINCSSSNDPAEKVKSDMADLANDTAELLGLGHKFRSDEMLVTDDYIGEGYGVMGDLERDAIHTLAQKRGCCWTRSIPVALLAVCWTW